MKTAHWCGSGAAWKKTNSGGKIRVILLLTVIIFWQFKKVKLLEEHSLPDFLLGTILDICFTWER